MKRFFFIFYLFSIFAHSQALTVSEGYYISISENSSFNIDGIQFSPNSEYTIQGPNEFNRLFDPVFEGDNSSINRVYTMTSELLDYSGVITFNYEDNELNGIPESELMLEVLGSNEVWTNFTPTIDQNNNTLTYDFSSLFGFTAVTASSVNGTLSIEPVFLDGYIKVYPNPAIDRIYIKSDLNLETVIYNTAGQFVLESSEKEINVIGLPAGFYLLRIKSENNKISTFKITKK